MPHNSDKDLNRILANALKSSTIPWWEWDIESNTVTFNELKVTMLGYEPADFKDKGYQAYTELLHPDDHARAMQAMRDHLEGRAPIYQVDYRIRRSDGEYTWYMDRGSIIERASDGKPLRLRGVVLDLGQELREQARHETAVELVRRALPSPGRNEKLLVLCSSCKRLKVKESMWLAIEPSFQDAFEGRISHGICPDCVRRLYPEEAEATLQKYSGDE